MWHILANLSGLKKADLTRTERTVRTFLKPLIWIFSLLTFIVVGLSQLLSNYHLSPALAGLILMTLNALSAVAILHLPGQRDLIRTSLTSMVTRLLTLGAIMLAGMQFLKPTQAEAFSFVFTAMAGFVAFQVLEIRHFIRVQSRWGK